MLTLSAHPRNSHFEAGKGQNRPEAPQGHIAGDHERDEARAAEEQQRGTHAERAVRADFNALRLGLHFGRSPGSSEAGLRFDGTAGHFLFKSKTYERKPAPHVFATANVRLPVRHEREHRQRLASQHPFQARQVLRGSLAAVGSIEFATQPAQFDAARLDRLLRQQGMIQAPQPHADDQKRWDV